MLVDLKEVEAFFFEAMMHGYAVKGKKKAVAGMPGYKSIEYRRGNFQLVDRYVVTSESSRSAGTTTIWYKKVPVWVMTYSGFYKEDVVPFLQKALEAAYRRRDFIGGRGPYLFEREELRYDNRLELNCGFSQFKGREEVFNTRGGTFLGYHEYSGMSLL